MTAFDHPYELPKRQARHFFAPSRTIRCTGVPKFRSQHARDVATLLDVDDEVVAWNGHPRLVLLGAANYRPDFAVEYTIGRALVLATPEDFCDDPDAEADAKRLGYKLLVQRPSDLPPVRLQNAKDLIAAASFRVSLDERLRLLCFLDENGSAVLGECLSVMRTPTPMATLITLFRQRFVHIEMDAALSGTDTIVPRRRA